MDGSVADEPISGAITGPVGPGVSTATETNCQLGTAVAIGSLPFAPNTVATSAPVSERLSADGPDLAAAVASSTAAMM